MSKTLNVVIYSGGMDSYTTLHFAIKRAGPQGHVHAITFDYGQRHRKEIEYAVAETTRLNILHSILDLAPLASFVMGGSSLTTQSIPVPEGHYQEETMRATVVPGRNTIMLSLALAYAESHLLQYPGLKRAVIWYGAHSGDHHIYPDCRPGYVAAMQEAIEQASDGRISLVVPYLRGNKETILQDGFAWGLNYADTWTCYKGEELPCEKCGACQERALAFQALGMPDPLLVTV